MSNEYSFPVYGTQGGGLVQEVGKNCYVWVEPPDGFDFKEGDLMPEEWGIAPANEIAKRVLEAEVYRL